MKNPIKSLLALAALAAAGVTSANAQTLVTEFFDYSVTDNSSVNGLSGGTNWTTNWTVNGTANGFFQNVNLNYTDTTGYVNPTVTNNGSMGLESVNDTGNFGTNNQFRAFNPGISGNSTIWVSWLAQVNNSATSHQAYFMFGPAGSPQSYRVGLFGNGNNTLRVQGVYNNTATTAADFTGNSRTGLPNLFLMRLNINSAGNDSFDLWVNPSNATSLASLGSANYTSNSTNSFYNTGNFYITLGFRSPSGNASYIDSIRIAYGGSSDEDRMLAVIPEPTTWALLAVGLTTFVIFRRRNRQS